MSLPRIEVRDNPWGESATEDGKITPRRDRFYLPGYSDKRSQWEREMAEYRAGQRATPPAPLDYRFQWVSVKSPQGVDRGDKFQEFASMGYTAIDYEDAAAYGLDLSTTAVQKGPDGKVYQGSQMLMVIDRKGAARIAAEVREAQQAQQDAIQFRANATADAVFRKIGLAPRSEPVFEIAVEGDES